ncbi:hypothetical protein AMS60_01740 [Bacillus sp. FJAT-21945]|nr:hypothetical protein AMS60_01740 [Bacillus sp. FJAT-21945]
MFLKKYEGPVIEDAYRLMGLHQGHYKIDKEGEIYPVGENKLKEISNLIEISNLNVLDTFMEKATKQTKNN